MDQILSQIIPINRIGEDGFNWWIGQVEQTSADDPNNNGGHRFKVRIVGEHPQSKELLDTTELPWANVMMPVTVPFIPGNTGGATPQLDIGCWVVGFYLDQEKQKPLIMGSIGQTPGATTILKNRRPDDLPFTTSIPTGNITKYKEGVVPAKDGVPVKENPKGEPLFQPLKVMELIEVLVVCQMDQLIKMENQELHFQLHQNLLVRKKIGVKQ